MNRLKIILLYSIVMFMLSGCALFRHPPPLQADNAVEIGKLAGLWYEIARVPNDLQGDCRETSIEYIVRSDTEMNVVSRCKYGINDRDRELNGRLWISDAVDRGKFKISFFWPFRNDYWVVGFGEQYEYAVISTPDRHYVWILSRTTTLDADSIKKINTMLEVKHFDKHFLLNHTEKKVE